MTTVNMIYTVDGSEIPFPTTGWMVLKLVVNNGMNYQPEVVIAGLAAINNMNIM